MTVRRILFGLFLLSVFTTSCHSATEQKASNGASDSLQTAVSAPGSVTRKSAPGQETAETIVAGYYSGLNRAAGYIRYKALGLNILEIKPEQDSTSYLIFSENTGRIRIHNSEDTSSAAFAEKLTLRASFVNNNWEAEPIP